jgi:hypothetical protein
MRRQQAEAGVALIGALWVGLLLAMLGGIAMNLAVTETTASSRYVDEKSAQLLAESGVEQVVAWLTQGALPAPYDALSPVRCNGTPTAPDAAYDAARPEEDRVLNTTSEPGALTSLGRVTRARLYGPGHPDGGCALEVSAEARGGSRRTVALELGVWRIPSLRAPVQADGHSGDRSVTDAGPFPKVQTRWGDRVSNSPPSPWPYQTFKDYAQRFGSYYVPDREGRLYRNGSMDPAHVLAPSQVFGSREVGDQRGLVFVDTLDQRPPNETNQATLTLEAPYMEGTFYINAHVVLLPQGAGRSVEVLAPPLGASRETTTLAQVTINGVLHTTGTLRVDRDVRVFGAILAERGLTGEGLLEVWYDADLGRGRVRGLPVVFPVRGTWREWSDG